MIVLEIAMLLIGVLAVVYSVRVSEKHKGTENLKERVEYMEYADFPEKEWTEKIDKLREKAEDIYHEVDDKLSKLSNEKIIGMNEFSDQVLDKIEKNHGEVVFLYDRMNEKQAEIQKTVDDVQKTVEEADSMRATLKDDTEKEFQKLIEKEEVLDQMKKDIELEAIDIQEKQKEIKESQIEIKERQMEIKESQIEIKERQKQLEESQKEMEEKQRHMGDFVTDDFLSEISESLKSDVEEEEPEVLEEEEFLSPDGEKLTGVELAREKAKRKREKAKMEREKERAEKEKAEKEKAEKEKAEKEKAEEAISASDVIDAEIRRIEEAEEKEMKEKTESKDSIEEDMFIESEHKPVSEQEPPKNHNDAIIDLYKKGRSIVEISRMLSLGQGEVKFVIDLYNAR